MNKKTEDLIKRLSSIDKLCTKWGDYPCLEKNGDGYHYFDCVICYSHNQEYLLLKEHIDKYHPDYKKYKSMNKIILDYCLTHKEHMTDELYNIFDKLNNYTEIKKTRNCIYELKRLQDREPYINLN